MPCNTNEAISLLEEEGALNPKEGLNTSSLVDALVHLSTQGNMLVPAQTAIQAVALILNQLKLARTREDITSLIEGRVNALMDSMTKEATAAMKVAADTVAAQVKATAEEA